MREREGERSVLENERKRKKEWKKREDRARWGLEAMWTRSKGRFDPMGRKREEEGRRARAPVAKGYNNN